MARIITARMAKAIHEGKPIALLVYVDHPDGAQFLWTGVGTLSYNGQDWDGVGRLGGITPIKRTSELAIQEVVMTLNGVPPDAATWLSSNVRNRQAQAWLACIDKGKVVPEPMQVVELVLDFQTFSIDDNGIASISLNALSGFVTLERAIRDVWSEQDQKTRFPDDTGFNQLTLLQNQEVKWTVS